MPRKFTKTNTYRDWLDAIYELDLNDECLDFPGATSKHGYGKVQIRGKTTVAHRYIVEKMIGRPLEPHEYACHHCDNRRCVNKFHLYCGNAKTNSHDCWSRGRGKPASIKGQAHYNARLTEKDVRAIRALYIPGVITMKRLGEVYGVTESMVCCIIKYKNWKHI